jgi:peptide/nickel transport system permease protein
VAASLFLFFLLVVVVAPGLVARDGPLSVNPNIAFTGPTLSHLFGTDDLGRDVFSRVLYGARESIVIGVAATAIGLAVGCTLGLAAGLGGRFLSGIANRVIEVLLAFPGLLLALLVVAISGAGATTVVIAVGLGAAPGYARLLRGQTLSIRNAEFVEAARALGHSRPAIVRRNVFPNAMRPLVVLGALGIGQSIIWASSLGFLGLGVVPPAPEWGAMLAEGRDFISQAWWLEVFPGAVIVATTLSTTAVGRHLQRMLEGRLRS